MHDSLNIDALTSRIELDYQLRYSSQDSKPVDTSTSAGQSGPQARLLDINITLPEAVQERAITRQALSEYTKMGGVNKNRNRPQRREESGEVYQDVHELMASLGTASPMESPAPISSSASSNSSRLVDSNLRPSIPARFQEDKRVGSQSTELLEAEIRQNSQTLARHAASVYAGRR